MSPYLADIGYLFQMYYTLWYLETHHAPWNALEYLYNYMVYILYGLFKKNITFYEIYGRKKMARGQ